MGCALCENYKPVDKILSSAEQRKTWAIQTSNMRVCMTDARASYSDPNDSTEKMLVKFCSAMGIIRLRVTYIVKQKKLAFSGDRKDKWKYWKRLS